ncbi:STAS domain-containing protein [Catellatospora coxensis]
MRPRPGCRRSPAGAAAEPPDATTRGSHERRTRVAHGGRQRQLRVTAVGGLHADNAHRLPKVVLGLLRQYAPEAVLLDLGAVTRIDTVGVAAVVLCQKTTARHGATFTLDGCSPPSGRHCAPTTPTTCCRPSRHAITRCPAAPPHRHRLPRPIPPAVVHRPRYRRAEVTGSRLHLRLQATATGLRLVACGRLDAATGRQLGQAISLALHRLRAQRLTLDLTAVNAIDAAGVAALIRGRVEADRCDVVLTIADPSPALLHAMRLHAAGARPVVRPGWSAYTFRDPSGGACCARVRCDIAVCIRCGEQT